MEDEKELISRLNMGDAHAFKLLYNRYSGKVYNFVMKVSRGDCYLAEEIVQNVFIKVWEVRLNVDAQKSFIAYLCTIAKNMVVNIFLHQMQEQQFREKRKLQSDCEMENATDNEVDYRFF